jgi:uncharacterized OB-fold protein
MTARPVPVTTVETKPFWDGTRQHDLCLPQCVQCGYLHYPPQPRCRRCSAQDMTWTTLSGRGRLWSWTIVHLPSLPGVEPPFAICEVELEEQDGLMFVALADVAEHDLATGLQVEVRFAEDENGTAYPQVHRP